MESSYERSLKNNSTSTITAKIEKKAMTMKKLSFSASNLPLLNFFIGNFNPVPLGNFILAASPKQNLYFKCSNVSTKNPILWLLECNGFLLRGFVEIGQER